LHASCHAVATIDKAAFQPVGTRKFMNECLKRVIGSMSDEFMLELLAEELESKEI
jgi:hypothetical protein